MKNLSLFFSLFSGKVLSFQARLAYEDRVQIRQCRGRGVSEDGTDINPNSKETNILELPSEILLNLAQDEGLWTFFEENLKDGTEPVTHRVPVAEGRTLLITSKRGTGRLSLVLAVAAGEKPKSRKGKAQEEVTRSETRINMTHTGLYLLLAKAPLVHLLPGRLFDENFLTTGKSAKFLRKRKRKRIVILWFSSKLNQLTTTFFS